MHPTDHIDDIIGLSETEAQEYGAMHHIRVRTVRKGNVRYLCTQDHNPYRLNISLDNDKVTKVTYG